MVWNTNGDPEDAEANHALPHEHHEADPAHLCYQHSLRFWTTDVTKVGTLFGDVAKDGILGLDIALPIFGNCHLHVKVVFFVITFSFETSLWG